MFRLPSEETGHGQWDQRRRQEVGHSVEMERREGHHGDAQGQGKVANQTQEFTGEKMDKQKHFFLKHW